MQKQIKKSVFKTIGFLIIFSIISINLFTQTSVWADFADEAQENTLTQVRTYHSPSVVRIEFDIDSLPSYTKFIAENQEKIIINLLGVKNKSYVSELSFDDPVIESLIIADNDEMSQIEIFFRRNLYAYKISTLENPSRLVINIIKEYEERTEEQITPKIKYTSLKRLTARGRISAHILEISPDSGYVLRPVLGRGAVRGLEQLSSMSERVGALAMVNGSYFHTDGSTIGFLKMNGEVVSVPNLPRTALGIIKDAPDQGVIIGQPNYSGRIEFFNNRRFVISSVNRERGPNELILYNGWYDSSTRTNPHGIERTVMNGKVIAEGINNSHIPRGAVVLSGHGTAAQVLEELRIGDDVRIIETLGGRWDNADYAIGAGPMLVMNRNIFLTTEAERFGSDVAGGRAPRTAAGITADGTILLVVVDGRQAISMGMTLFELAEFMQELGAQDAMNFDGGGSSVMVIKDTIVNSPSGGQERRMGSAIALLPEN